MSAAGLVLLLTIAQAPPSSEDPVVLIKRAASAYRAGEHRDAGDLFLRAYELTKVPTQLRNAAKAYTDGALWSEAFEAWNRYRGIDGLSASAVSEADAQIALIEERRAADDARRTAEAAQKAAAEAREKQEIAERRAAAAEAERRAAAAVEAPPRPPAPEPSLAVETTPDADPSAPWRWATVGVGGAALITSGVLFLHADGRLGRLDDRLGTTDGAGKVVGIDRGAAQGELDGINTERNVSVAVAAVGAAVVVVGVVWMLLAD